MCHAVAARAVYRYIMLRVTGLLLVGAAEGGLGDITPI